MQRQLTSESTPGSGSAFASDIVRCYASRRVQSGTGVNVKCRVTSTRALVGHVENAFRSRRHTSHSPNGGTGRVMSDRERE